MRRGLAIAAVALGTLLFAGSAAASYHLMKISEVHPPSTMSAQDAFVELQMHAAGQNLVDGKRLSYYSPAGLNTPATFLDSDVPNGESQRTILIGDTDVAGADFTDPTLSAVIEGGGGGVCFQDPTTDLDVDCVAWGPFQNLAGLPVGSAAAVIPLGQSLTRSIAPNCPTLLEAEDDTDNSATDFALRAPTPRPNSTAPTEQPCAADDTKAPQTRITKAPKRRTEKTIAKFKFKSSEPDSTFECKFDRSGYEPCRSPERFRRLDEGKHKFRVRATDATGNTDPSPAKAKFKVLA